MPENPLIVVRGGGNLATGVIQKLFHAGLKVVVLESQQPSAIRRAVSLCDAVYNGVQQVEDMTCRLVAREEDMRACHKRHEIPLLADPGGQWIPLLRPKAVIDAIACGRNLGTHRGMAPITIALGAGFCAGQDVDVVIETARGHDLGRLIFEGSALPGAGESNHAGGTGNLRAVLSPTGGRVRHIKAIGDIVHLDEPLFLVEQTFVKAPIMGRLRGLIHNGYAVSTGMKVADVDAFIDVNWRTISYKARAVGGGVLEAYLLLARDLRQHK